MQISFDIPSFFLHLTPKRMENAIIKLFKDLTNKRTTTMWDKSYLDKLNEYKAKSVAGGGAARVEKQHSQGKLTARARLEILFDKGTFR